MYNYIKKLKSELKSYIVYIFLIFIKKSYIFYTKDIISDDINIIAKPITEILTYELEMIYNKKNNIVLSVKKDNKMIMINDNTNIKIYISKTFLVSSVPK